MPDRHCSCDKDERTCRKHNVVDLNKYRWRRAGYRLRQRLAEFADHEMFLEDIEVAREYFIAVMDEDLVDEEDEILLERFFEWFIFDYRMREQTLIEYFDLAGNLAPEEKELLGIWKNTRVSFYQVVDVSSKYKVVLEDIIRGGQVVVNDSNAVHELEPGQIMFMRILAVGDENEFSTGSLVLPPESYSYILSRVKLDAELYWGEYGGRGNWDLYLGARAHVLNALAVEIGSIWGFPIDEGGEPDSPSPSRDHFADMAQQVTNIFLDYFYDRWINEPMGVLQGKTPMEASRTKLGRQKLQTLLYELGKIEIARAKRGEPYYDLSRLRQKLSLPENFNGHDLPEPTDGVLKVEYEDVALLIRAGLEKMGYRSEVARAMDLWEKYSRAARPVFRKPGAWAAAVIYAVAKLLGDEKVKQNELAHLYNVSASTISTNYRNICQTLRLNS